MEVGQDTANAGQAPSEGTGAGENKQETQAIEDVVAKATHQRVLKESQGFKQRAFQAEERLKEIEDEALKIQQNHEERANRFQKQLQDAMSEKSALLKRVSLEPALRAAGCVDVATAIQIGDANLLQEEGAVLAGVDEFVEGLKASKPYLFTSQTPSSVNTAVPSGGLKKAAAKTDFSNMTAAELKEAWRQLEK